MIVSFQDDLLWGNVCVNQQNENASSAAAKSFQIIWEEKLRFQFYFLPLYQYIDFNIKQYKSRLITIQRANKCCAHQNNVKCQQLFPNHNEIRYWNVICDSDLHRNMPAHTMKY